MTRVQVDADERGAPRIYLDADVDKWADAPIHDIPASLATRYLAAVAELDAATRAILDAAGVNP